MNQIDPVTYINGANDFYWKCANKIYKDIRVFEVDEDVSNVYVENYEVRIHISISGDKQASFNHELLHLYFDYLKVNPSSSLKRWASDFSIIREHFSDDQFDELGNQLVHVKMLQIYLSMGSAKEHFLFDYSVVKGEGEQITLQLLQIKPHINGNESYLMGYVIAFVHKYVQMLGCPNTDLDYSSEFNDLKKLDEALYLIMETFSNTWKKLDVVSENAPLEVEMIILGLFDQLTIFIGERI